MLYKYRKWNNYFATTGLVGEFRASSHKKIWQMMQFGEFWSITKTLLHRMQFIQKFAMCVQERVPLENIKNVNLAHLEYIC